MMCCDRWDSITKGMIYSQNHGLVVLAYLYQRRYVLYSTGVTFFVVTRWASSSGTNHVSMDNTLPSRTVYFIIIY